MFFHTVESDSYMSCTNNWYIHFSTHCTTCLQLVLQFITFCFVLCFPSCFPFSLHVISYCNKSYTMTMNCYASILKNYCVLFCQSGRFNVQLVRYLDYRTTGSLSTDLNTMQIGGVLVDVVLFLTELIGDVVIISGLILTTSTLCDMRQQYV